MSLDQILLGLIFIASVVDLGVMIHYNKPKGIPLSALVASPDKVEAIVKAAVAPEPAPAPAIAPVVGIAFCSICHSSVARFTQTPEGPVCANCLPIK